MMKSAVIFDLDGTLTRPVLDFDVIRAEIGVTDGPLLEAIQRMNADQQERAMGILEHYEEDAARRSTLHDGAAQTLAALRENGLGVAILTRNARRWAEVVIQRHSLEIDALRTRDDGAIKPSPAPLLWLCKELHADPARSWMVGDYRFDLECGRSAGTGTILMIGEAAVPPYADMADHVIRRLGDVLSIVKSAPGVQ